MGGAGSEEAAGDRVDQITCHVWNMKKYTFWCIFAYQTMYDFVCLQCKGDGTREQGWRMCIDLPLAFCLYEQYWCVASGIREMRTEETYLTVILVY